MTLPKVRSYPRRRKHARAPIERSRHRHRQRETVIRPAASTPSDPGPAEGRILRAKYFDWCSARVAEHFVSLDVRQIYELAGLAGEGEDLPFPEVVDRATEALAAQMSLPSFDEWVTAYRANPQKYDDDLAGFWEGQV